MNRILELEDSLHQDLFASRPSSTKGTDGLIRGGLGERELRREKERRGVSFESSIGRVGSGLVSRWKLLREEASFPHLVEEKKRSKISQCGG